MMEANFDKTPVIFASQPAVAGKRLARLLSAFRLHPASSFQLLNSDF